MAEAATLPRNFVVLGDALKPISRRIACRMEGAPPRTAQRVNVIEFTRRHLQLIRVDVAKLGNEIDGELGSAITSEKGDADIWRAVARMEIHIERLLDGFDEVRRVKPNKADALGFSLLGNLYRAPLKQIQEWMKEILDMVDDPLAAAVRNRGLAMQGEVDLTIPLTFEVSPQIRSLWRWLEQRMRERAAAERRRRTKLAATERRDIEAGECAKSSGYGLLALVLAAFGLGWILGGDGDE